jgi:hypothetical protein
MRTIKRRFASSIRSNHDDETAADGRVKLEVYPNSILDKDKDETKALQPGAVQSQRRRWPGAARWAAPEQPFRTHAACRPVPASRMRPAGFFHQRGYKP